jgi:DNA-binding MarR family transcriptional regulator
MPVTIEQTLDQGLITRAMVSYGGALAVADPIRLRFWDKRGLTMAQLRLMYTMLLDGEQAAGELAEKMSVRPPTITGLTNRLIKQKLIRRLADPNDRRIVRVDLTAEGRRVISQIETASRAYLARIFNQLGEAKVKELIALLDEFSAAGQSVQSESEFRP